MFSPVDGKMQFMSDSKTFAIFGTILSFYLQLSLIGMKISLEY